MTELRSFVPKVKELVKSFRPEGAPPEVPLLPKPQIEAQAVNARNMVVEAKQGGMSTYSSNQLEYTHGHVELAKQCQGTADHTVQAQHNGKDATITGSFDSNTESWQVTVTYADGSTAITASGHENDTYPHLLHATEDVAAKSPDTTKQGIAQAHADTLKKHLYVTVPGEKPTTYDYWWGKVGEKATEGKPAGHQPSRDEMLRAEQQLRAEKKATFQFYYEPEARKPTVDKRTAVQRTEQVDLNLAQADKHLEGIAKKLQRDKKNRDLVEQLLRARQAGGDLSNRDIHAAIKYSAILTGYRRLSPTEQRDIGLSDELLSTMHGQVRPGAERLKQIFKTVTAGEPPENQLTDAELEALGGMLTGGTMANFLEPMADVLGAPDVATRNELIGKMNEMQQKIMNNKRLIRELNTTIYGSAEGVSAGEVDAETDKYLAEGRAQNSKDRNKGIATISGIGGLISLYMMMQAAEGSAKEEQQLLQQN